MHWYVWVRILYSLALAWKIILFQLEVDFPLLLANFQFFARSFTKSRTSLIFPCSNILFMQTFDFLPSISMLVSVVHFLDVRCWHFVVTKMQCVLVCIDWSPPVCLPFESDFLMLIVSSAIVWRGFLRYFWRYFQGSEGTFPATNIFYFKNPPLFYANYGTFPCQAYLPDTSSLSLEISQRILCTLSSHSRVLVSHLQATYSFLWSSWSITPILCFYFPLSTIFT